MMDPFAELQPIWSAGAQKNMEMDTLNFLERHGIRPRQNDGELRQVTLSKPISVNSCVVIGLRYLKRDGTQTEDLFPVQQGHRVQKCYRGSLQYQWPEYRGTHKQWVDFTKVAAEPPPNPTLVNTITAVIPG